MRRNVLLVLVAAGLSACFNPSPPDEFELTDGEMTESGTVSASGSPTAGSSGMMTTVNDTDEPTVTATNTESDTETEGGAVCGNGEVEGDEACDDGVNDGSYGGCLEDCSAQAARCGDGELNGPEVCDDGVNDGSYGGCADDCAAVGPYCGDGTQNGPEGCDNGDANENASGCNVDCVVSGSSVALFEMDGLSFCDGYFLTKAAFRDNGNGLIAATGYCDSDSVVLAELDPDLALQEDFGDDVLLPETPVRQGTLLGDDWLLANYSCNYLVSSTGELTEVCGDRVQGEYFLESIADDEYVALDYNALARFGAGSPSAGDSPTWQVAPPDNASYTYTFNSASPGQAGSTFIGGYRRTVSNGTYSGYLALYTAGGNPADSRVETRTQYIDGVHGSPDGTFVAWGTSPDPLLFKYNAGLNDVWNHPLPSNLIYDIAIDSVGDIVIVYRTAAGATEIRKVDPDGTTTKWTNSVVDTYGHRISIDATDHIWVGAIAYNVDSWTLTVERFAP